MTLAELTKRQKDRVEFFLLVLCPASGPVDQTDQSVKNDLLCKLIVFESGKEENACQKGWGLDSVMMEEVPRTLNARKLFIYN